MNILDVDNWSKDAVKQYLTSKVPLNDSIEKIASEQGLNKDQISRLVEAANTDTYVQLFNQADDKYITYETADAEKIAERIFGTEKTAEVALDDYQEPPVRNELEVSIDTPLPMEKSAEYQPTTTTNEELHEYYKVAALESRMAEKMDEIEVAFQKDSSILSSLIKQAVLGGTSYGDIEKAVTTVYDSPVVRVSLQETQTKLAQELYPKQLNTAITDFGTVNLENPIVKQAGLLLKHAEEYKKLKSKHAETKDKVQGHLKKSSMLKSAVNMSTGAIVKTVGASAVAGGIATHEIAKKKMEQDSTRNDLRSLPGRFVR